MSEPAHQSRGRPRGFDIDQVLDRAIAVFWQKGYAGASISDLTQATAACFWRP
jgi:AcrR family transcriptional regulator